MYSDLGFALMFRTTIDQLNFYINCKSFTMIFYLTCHNFGMAMPTEQNFDGASRSFLG